MFFRKERWLSMGPSGGRLVITISSSVLLTMMVLLGLMLTEQPMLVCTSLIEVIHAWLHVSL